MIKKVKTTEVALERTIPASPAAVYRAWLDPRNPATPWNDAEKLIFNPKVDGMYYFRHAADNGEKLPHAGRFTQLKAGRKIQYTWMSRHTQGLESVVTVTLAAKGRDTVLSLSHANLPDNWMGRKHREGWTYFTDLFVKRFPARR